MGVNEPDSFQKFKKFRRRSQFRYSVPAEKIFCRNLLKVSMLISEWIKGFLCTTFIYFNFEKMLALRIVEFSLYIFLLLISSTSDKIGSPNISKPPGRIEKCIRVIWGLGFRY